jgi:prevent-host-death family protein
MVLDDWAMPEPIRLVRATQMFLADWVTPGAFGHRGLAWGEARLSELVKRAQQQPQKLTSHGEPVAVVLSAEDYHRHRHEGESLVAFIRRSPLVGVDDLDLERSSDFTRDMEL